MNRNEFFAVAKITKAPITVIQDEDKGYYLTLQSTNDEGSEENFTLLYNGAPRYFKSLNGIETTLKDKGLFSFSVKMSSVEVSVRKRTPKMDQAPITPKKAK